MKITPFIKQSEIRYYLGENKLFTIKTSISHSSVDKIYKGIKKL
jgi:hypothetical protein